MEPPTARLAMHPGAPGTGIERKVERLQGEVPIDPRGRTQGHYIPRAEQRHLQAAVLLQFEPVLSLNDLADGESYLFVAVVHATPLRGLAVSRKVGRKVARRCQDERAVDEERHCGDPCTEHQERDRARDP